MLIALAGFSMGRFRAVILSLVVVSGVVFGQNGPPRLFRAVSNRVVRGTETAVKRSRAVTLDKKLIDGSAADGGKVVVLNLFDDVTLTATMLNTWRTSDGKTVLWVGKVDGTQFGEAIMAITGDVVSGKFTNDDG